MTKGLLDPRVAGPLAVAALVFALREVGEPRELPPAAPVAAHALPVPYGSACPRHDTDYDLDVERSTVRFLIGADSEHLLACPLTSGKLHCSADRTTDSIELRFDLASLVPEPAGGGGALPDLWHLLGVNSGTVAVFTGTLASTSTTPLPALHHQLWNGTLRFGNRTVRQTVGLWQTALPGQPLRLQGHGQVGAETIGLRRRRWFGLVRETHVVTLGLDLAWKRASRS